MRYYLITLTGDGQPLVVGPYPDAEAQKGSARKMMSTGIPVFYLDVGPFADQAPSVGRVLRQEGVIGSGQRLRVEVIS